MAEAQLISPSENFNHHSELLGFAKNPYDKNMEFTYDFYRCGCCSREYDQLEDLIIHKINEESCSLVLLPSPKLSGIQIPRFIQDTNLVSKESVEPLLNDAPCSQDEPEVVSSKDETQQNLRNERSFSLKVDGICDESLNFLHALPGTKTRSECKICGNSYRDATILKTHIATVHSVGKPYACDFEHCPFACKTKASLERHIRRHTGERPFVCESCGRSFRESGTLARHVKSRVPCTRKSDNALPRYGKPSLSRARSPQIVQAKPVEIVVPKDCDAPSKEILECMEEGAKITLSEDTLDSLKKDASQSLIQLLESSYPKAMSAENYALQHPIIEHQVEEVDLQVLSKVKETVEEQISTHNFYCLVCSTKSQNANELSQHLQQHLEDYKFRCEKCYYVDKYCDGLSKHSKDFHSKQSSKIILPTDWSEVASTQLILLHDALDEKVSGQKAGSYNRCHVCLKKFSHKSYFRLHMNSHTGGAQFECDVCKRTFINKDSLQKHLVSHSSKRSFQCQKCARTFKRLSHLKDHMRTHNDLKPYICKTCNRSFKWQCVLKVHETTHSRDCFFGCETCGKQLRNKSSLIRHSKRHKGVGKKSSTSTGAGIVEVTPSAFEQKSDENEAKTAAANISSIQNQTESPNQHTYFLVLDENALVLGDGACMLENSMIQPEDMLE
ncbi:transcription factor E4F1-like [Neocloeon triangulifer]|uniref:transcription factor E4F1-like n=1 Tax=Neocloeon triangulifer TaxID=2078957 RepID=UPI00286F9AB3|nr:transcription factor E4F1-like [Neocloeon triangulifer]XP_059473004.1 transcription factor E4F1-like [Neocloeon triangulifer]